MVKITASSEKIYKHLKKKGEGELTLSFKAKQTKEGRRLMDELNRRTKYLLKKQNIAVGKIKQSQDYD